MPGKPTPKPPWSCPRCGRTFAKPKQWHSCQVRTVAHHFQGKAPALRSIFDALCRALERTGPFRVDAVESSIHLVSVHHFGGIAVRKDYLRIGFLADREIRHRRIVGVERIGPRRVGHHVVVRSIADLDTRLLGWLSEAQAMQASKVKNEPKSKTACR